MLIIRRVPQALYIHTHICFGNFTNQATTNFIMAGLVYDFVERIYTNPLWTFTSKLPMYRIDSGRSGKRLTSFPRPICSDRMRVHDYSLDFGVSPSNFSMLGPLPRKKLLDRKTNEWVYLSSFWVFLIDMSQSFLVWRDQKVHKWSRLTIINFFFPA